ncbi:hypothetical protein JCM10212_003330 [Sporobolomyces blumeae]
MSVQEVESLLNGLEAGILALQRAQPPHEHVETFGTSSSLSRLNSLNEQDDLPGWDDVRSCLKEMYGPGPNKLPFDPSRINAGELGVSLGLATLRRVALDTPSVRRSMHYVVEQLIAALAERVRTYIDASGTEEKPDGNDDKLNGDEPPRAAKRGRAPSPVDEKKPFESPAPPSSRRGSPTPSSGAADDDDEAVVGEQAQAGPAADVDPYDPSRPFNPIDHASWADPTLFVQPPDDLPRSHDGLSIFDVPFARQITVPGRRRKMNDIGGGSQENHNAKSRLLFPMNNWQEPPRRVGEPFLMGANREWIEEVRGPDAGEAIDDCPPVSCFFRRSPGDWRYVGEVVPHAVFRLGRADLACMSEDEWLRWDAYFDSDLGTLRDVKRMLGFSTEASRGEMRELLRRMPSPLNWTVFKVVGYDRAKMRVWLANHEITAEAKRARLKNKATGPKRTRPKKTAKETGRRAADDGQKRRKRARATKGR